MNDMPATMIAAPEMRVVPLALIDDDGNDVRRVKVSARADTVLQGSIRRHGVLEPIGLRPKGNRFSIVFGRGRLRNVRALDGKAIPAIISDWNDEAIRAVQLAENLHRTPVHPIDQWHAVTDLLAAGYTMGEAAEEFGLDERATRRMERLAKLDPAMLALIEIEMPPDHVLRTIANAPAKAQLAALKGVRAKPDQFNWLAISERCRVTRIEKSAAIFDADAHADLWDEDLFAQPDDDSRFTTADIARFIKLQSDALDAHIEAERAARKRVLRAEFNAARHEVTLPKNFRLLSTIPGSKPKRTECVFIALKPDGRVAEVLALDVAAEKAAEKQREQRATEKAKASTPDTPAADTAPGEPEDDAPPPETAKPAMTKAGLDLVAAAKTKALHDRLAWVAADIPLGELTRLLLLAFTASNIEIRSYRTRKAIAAIAARQLLPGGQVTPLDEPALRGAATKLLTVLLEIGGPSSGYGRGSGDTAEWIGAAIGAGEALPRFDTEAVLATLSGEALRVLAVEALIKPTGAVAALRGKLAGALPAWRPDAAAFGASAPEIEADDADDE